MIKLSFIMTSNDINELIKVTSTFTKLSMYMSLMKTNYMIPAKSREGKLTEGGEGVLTGFSDMIL